MPDDAPATRDQGFTGNASPENRVLFEFSFASRSKYS